MAQVRQVVRKILYALHCDVTKGLRYDRLTERILRQILKADSNAVDVGANKGEILRIILKIAPMGIHYAFEPLPQMYSVLSRLANERCLIFPHALSDSAGTAEFHVVPDDLALSGFRNRPEYLHQAATVPIQVQVETLDNLMSESHPTHLIKIDVEGAELGVLLGAKQVITKWKPFVLFECGLGGADYYQTTPDDIFSFFQSQGMFISSLSGFLAKADSYTAEGFGRTFREGDEYYFIAYV